MVVTKLEALFQHERGGNEETRTFPVSIVGYSAEVRTLEPPECKSSTVSPRFKIYNEEAVLDLESSMNRGDWCSGSALDLFSEGSGLESWAGNRL